MVAADLYLKGLPALSLSMITFKAILDGLIAGGTGAFVVYPIDLIKTRLQHQDQNNPEYDGPIDCVKTIVREEGVGGIYKGIIPVMCSVGPEKGFRVVCYNALKENFLTSPFFAPIFAPLPWIVPCAVAGLIAGGAQVVVANPVEKIKIRMQLQSRGGASLSVRDVVQELGVNGLYQGSPVTIVRDVPSVGIFFAVYELLKYQLSGGGVEGLGFGQLMLSGLLAGIPAAALVTPMDVVKTRWQAVGGMDKYKDPMDVLQRSVQEEGMEVLMTGWGARVLRVSPQLAINLAMFEILGS